MAILWPTFGKKLGEFLFQYFFENMGQPRPLIRLFSVFSSKQDNSFNKSMRKMSIQYTALGFEPITSRTWVVTHNH